MPVFAVVCLVTLGLLAAEYSFLGFPHATIFSVRSTVPVFSMIHEQMDICIEMDTLTRSDLLAG